jgi:hypothetical protein
MFGYVPWTERRDRVRESPIRGGGAGGGGGGWRRMVWRYLPATLLTGS